jgi:hypothetical protein
MDIRWYLMSYYSRRRPHVANGGLALATKENEPKILSGNS